MTLGDLANIAAIVGCAGVVLAWLTYVNTRKRDETTHLNTMFKEYLRLDFDHHSKPPEERQDAAIGRLRAYKMWVLDEIYDWIERAEKQELNFWTYAAKHKHRRQIFNWRETVKYHLHRHSCEKYWAAFIASRDCYSEKFYLFALDWHIDSPKHKADHKGCELCALMKDMEE